MLLLDRMIRGLISRVAYHRVTVQELISRYLPQPKHNQPLPISLSAAPINQLAHPDREIFMKYLLMGIYKNKYVVGGECTIDALLGGFPELQLEWRIFQINHQLKDESLINDLYYQCFNRILPTIKQKDKQCRASAILHKNFAKHLVNTQPNHQQIKQFLSSAISKFSEVIKLEVNKLESKEYLIEKQQNKKQYDLRVNANKENVRKLVESTAECGYLLFTSTIPNRQNQIKQLEDVFFVLKDCIRLYNVIPGIKPLSQYYHKIKKIQLELQGIILTHQRPQGQFKLITKVSLAQQLTQFYLECQNHIPQVTQFPQNMREILIAMATVKYHLLKPHINQPQLLKRQLMDWSGDLIKKTPQSYRKSLMKVLVEVIKSLMEKI